MKESDLQRKIKKALNEETECYFEKMHGGPHSPKGLPDLVGCAHGVFVGIEVKMPGRESTLTEIQAHKLKAIKDAGGISGVASSVEQAFNIIVEGLKEWDLE